MPSSVIEKKTTKSNQKQNNPKYNVILHNDDVTPMDSVIRCLMNIIGINNTAAYNIMMTAHQVGKAIAISCELEHAEHYKEQLMQNGLTASIQRA